MKQNKYDDDVFFDKYSKMERSQKGLAGAGEWHCLQKMLPNFTDKSVLDLGCGFGWHCEYALEHGARSVVGVDISEKMLAQAREKAPAASYLCMPIEDIAFPAHSFDIALSSLALHYVADIPTLFGKIHVCLRTGGDFVFSVEHPIFTAQGSQDWHYAPDGTPLHWPVDRYFSEGQRTATFLGESVIKYHRTLSGYLNSLLQNNFAILEIIEPEPDPRLLKEIPELKQELRRPMMLLVSAKAR